MKSQQPVELGADRDHPEFVPFRDGLPFTSNLVALRQIIDQEFDDENEADKMASISTLWLRALRALSRSSPNAARTFHSNIWQQRQMNIQLASFTQPRHDTVLYAKQSNTIRATCEYADGMVDPYPRFWRRMQELAKRMEGTIRDILSPMTKCSSTHKGTLSSDSDFLVSNSQRFFRDFAVTMQSLEDIALCQCEHKALNEAQVNFLKTVMEERFGSGGSRYCGWYPSLFYESREDSGKRDVIVVDVHTDSPCAVHDNCGGILHLGVGDPLMGFFVVDKVMYAGPVFSNYEFVTPINERLTDEEFTKKLPAISQPQWAHQSYLC